VVDFSGGWEEIDIVPLKFDWEKLRSKIAEAMRLTAYARFSRWCRKAKKRRGDGSKTIGPIFLKPEEILRATKKRKLIA
jgi:hypothetical protein